MTQLVQDERLEPGTLAVIGYHYEESYKNVVQGGTTLREGRYRYLGS